MNDFIPPKIKNLTESKKRVIQNVERAIENNSGSVKNKWRYVVIATILTMSVMIFVLNEVRTENVPNTAEQHIGVSQPTISNEQGMLYLQGITLGDPQSQVIEIFGENYTKEHEDGSGSDYVMVYEDNMRFYIYQDKVELIIFMKVDKNYFYKLFNNYDGFKVGSSDLGDHDRFIYSKETNHILKATTSVPNKDLYLYLTYAAPEIMENPDFIEAERILQDSPEYVAKNEEELSILDSEAAYEMCKRVLTDYYKAVWNGSDIELGAFIDNENLKQYTQKKIQYQFDMYSTNDLTDDSVKSVDIGTRGADWEVEYTDDADGGFLYLKLPTEIKNIVGSYGEPTEFLVRNVNGKLVIVDWYTDAKDSYDFMVRGENLTIDNPNIWNDSEWVNKLNSKQIEFSGSIR